LRTAAEAAGASVLLGTAARRIEMHCHEQAVDTVSGGQPVVFTSDHLWSTIPITTLVRLIAPPAPAEVLTAASKLELRAMLLVYLVLGTDRFTEFDAHYFPGQDLPFTRVSEPKNYAALDEPKGVTVLCAEIPCGRGDALWSKPDSELGALVSDGLARSSLPVRAPILQVAVRRLSAAYPIYRRGYESHFEQVDGWVDRQDRVLSFGRQGLYAHDNTHHALYMARAAVDCLRDGELDRDRWQRYKKEFESHVVED
jgi:protoporphyrinogen oxidase